MIFCGDSLEVLKGMDDESVDMCLTSPPYWGLRDYGISGQLGLEETPDEYVDNLVGIFREVGRVLRDDGTLWLNLGDTYSNGSFGLKPKNLVGIPWMVAFALQSDGWYLRSDIIWSKPNPKPESATDRPTNSHEHIFLLSLNRRYYYDGSAIAEPAKMSSWATKLRMEGKRERQGPKMEGKEWRGQLTTASDPTTRNRRSVWDVPTKPFKGAHFAVFPLELIKPCILAGSPVGGEVLDPFGGSGTTAKACKDTTRKCVSIELNKKYLDIQVKRLSQEVIQL